jgi:hypothetical protein
LAKPLLSIGIVTFNSAGTIVPCLTSIVRYCPLEEIEIIVVDNNSDDETPELLKDNFLINKLTINSRNLGFATAVNKLISEMSGRHLLLLNPDCELQSHILPTITEIFSIGPSVGLIGADIRDAEGHPREAYGAFPSPSMVWWDFSGMRKIYPRRKWSTSVPFTQNSPLEVDYPTGAFYCIRDEAIDAEGMFDRRFFAYFEDADYALRLKKVGFRAIIHPTLRVRHLGGGSFKAAARRYDDDFQLACYFDSLFYFLEKHYGRESANRARVSIRRFATFKAALGGNSPFGRRHRQVIRILNRLEKSNIRAIYGV